MLDLLPAVPAAWPRGELRGTKARQQITVNRLAWDCPNKQITLQLTSERDQSIVLRLPNAEAIQRITTSGSPTSILRANGPSNQRTVALKAGQTVEFEIGVLWSAKESQE